MFSDPSKIGQSRYELIEKNCSILLNISRINMLNYAEKLIFFIHQEGVWFYNVQQDMLTEISNS